MCWRLRRWAPGATEHKPRPCLKIEQREACKFFRDPDANVLEIAKMARQSSVSQEQIFWDADIQILVCRHGCLTQMSSLLHRGHTNWQLQPCRLVRGRTSSIWKRD